MSVYPNDSARRKQAINKLLFEDRFHFFDADVAHLPDGLAGARGLKASR